MLDLIVVRVGFTIAGVVIRILRTSPFKSALRRRSLPGLDRRSLTPFSRISSPFALLRRSTNVLLIRRLIKRTLNELQ